MNELSREPPKKTPQCEAHLLASYRALSEHNMGEYFWRIAVVVVECSYGLNQMEARFRNMRALAAATGILEGNLRRYVNRMKRAGMLKERECPDGEAWILEFQPNSSARWKEVAPRWSPDHTPELKASFQEARAFSAIDPGQLCMEAITRDAAGFDGALWEAERDEAAAQQPHPVAEPHTAGAHIAPSPENGPASQPGDRTIVRVPESYAGTSSYGGTTPAPLIARTRAPEEHEHAYPKTNQEHAHEQKEPPRKVVLGADPDTAADHEHETCVDEEEVEMDAFAAFPTAELETRLSEDDWFELDRFEKLVCDPMSVRAFHRTWVIRLLDRWKLCATTAFQRTREHKLRGGKFHRGPGFYANRIFQDLKLGLRRSAKTK